MAAFIDCTSLSISYDIMGIATISYVVVSDTSSMKAYPDSGNTLSWGGQTFEGYIAAISMQQIPNTSWYENNVTLITTTR
jgi:hypothetical protein